MSIRRKTPKHKVMETLKVILVCISVFAFGVAVRYTLNSLLNKKKDDDFDNYNEF
jgi:hypothetical protein